MDFWRSEVFILRVYLFWKNSNYFGVSKVVLLSSGAGIAWLVELLTCFITEGIPGVTHGINSSFASSSGVKSDSSIIIRFILFWLENTSNYEFYVFIEICKFYSGTCRYHHCTSVRFNPARVSVSSEICSKRSVSGIHSASERYVISPSQVSGQR